MSASRKRTNEEILAAYTCSVTEAARVMQVRPSAIHALVETGRLNAFPSGALTKIGVPSLLRLIGADARPR